MHKCVLDCGMGVINLVDLKAQPSSLEHKYCGINVHNIIFFSKLLNFATI